MKGFLDAGAKRVNYGFGLKEKEERGTDFVIMEGSFMGVGVYNPSSPVTLTLKQYRCHLKLPLPPAANSLSSPENHHIAIVPIPLQTKYFAPHDVLIGGWWEDPSDAAKP